MKRDSSDIAVISRASPRRRTVEKEPAPPEWALRLTHGESTIGTAILVDEDRAGDHVADVFVRVGPDASLVTVSLGAVHRWDEAALADASERLFLLTLERLAQTPFPHPVRMWNFLPGICAPVNDELDRYRVFNAARRRAFACFFGDDAVASGLLPTASCVDPGGVAVSICALGAAEPGVPLENPRQVPAYRYSRKYGPMPPCFSRATLARFGDRRMLLVAGTASVIGESSAHDGSLPRQLEETMNNLRSIVCHGRAVAGERSTGDPLRDLRAVRVYARQESDLHWLRHNLPTELRTCSEREPEFFRAGICREELLVEIEMVVDVVGA